MIERRTIFTEAPPKGNGGGEIVDTDEEQDIQRRRLVEQSVHDQGYGYQFHKTPESEIAQLDAALDLGIVTKEDLSYEKNGKTRFLTGAALDNVLRSRWEEHFQKKVKKKRMGYWDKRRKLRGDLQVTEQTDDPEEDQNAEADNLDEEIQEQGLLNKIKNSGVYQWLQDKNDQLTDKAQEQGERARELFEHSKEKTREFVIDLKEVDSKKAFVIGAGVGVGYEVVRRNIRSALVRSVGPDMRQTILASESIASIAIPSLYYLHKERLGNMEDRLNTKDAAKGVVVGMLAGRAARWIYGELDVEEIEERFDEFFDADNLENQLAVEQFGHGQFGGGLANDLEKEELELADKFDGSIIEDDAVVDVEQREDIEEGLLADDILELDEETEEAEVNGEVVVEGENGEIFVAGPEDADEIQEQEDLPIDREHEFIEEPVDNEPEEMVSADDETEHIPEEQVVTGDDKEGMPEVVDEAMAVEVDEAEQIIDSSEFEQIDVRSGDTVTEMISRSGADPYDDSLTRFVLANEEQLRINAERVARFDEEMSRRMYEAINQISNNPYDFMEVDAEKRKILFDATRFIFPGDELLVPQD